MNQQGAHCENAAARNQASLLIVILDVVVDAFIGQYTRPLGAWDHPQGAVFTYRWVQVYSERDHA